MTNLTCPATDGLQQLIGAALTDSAILAQLLRCPLALASQFQMSLGERRFLASIHPTSLENFALLVEEWMEGEATADRPVRPAVRIQLAG